MLVRAVGYSVSCAQQLMRISFLASVQSQYMVLAIISWGFGCVACWEVYWTFLKNKEVVRTHKKFAIRNMKAINMVDSVEVF